VLSNILAHTPVTKSVNKNNASHAILFEAMKLIIIYKDIVNKVLKSQSIALLEMFIAVKEPNIRYLALECVASFSHLPYSEVIIVEKLDQILISLNDPDISIRRRALDILYLLCTA